MAGDAEHDEGPGTPPLGKVEEVEGGRAPLQAGKSSVEGGRASQEPDGRASRENGKVLLEVVEVVEVGGKASLEQLRMDELEVGGLGGKASLGDVDGRREHVCDDEVH